MEWEAVLQAIDEFFTKRKCLKGRVDKVHEQSCFIYISLTQTHFVCILHTETFFSSIKKNALAPCLLITLRPLSLPSHSSLWWTLRCNKYFLQFLFSQTVDKWQPTLSFSIGETMGMSGDCEYWNALPKSRGSRKPDTSICNQYTAVNLNSQELMNVF